MDGIQRKRVGLRVTISLFNSRCYSHQIRLWKHPKRIRIIEIVTFTLMRGSLLNLFHIKIHIGQN